MSVNRSLLSRGPAYVTYNSVNFFTEGDITVRHDPVWERVLTSMFGPVDTVKKDLILKISLKLWGAWENLSTLFPSALTNPLAGTSLFGTSDVPLTIQARNNDQFVYANAQITKLSNLYLGVDASLFSADVEFTALLANAANPEASGAYHTRGTTPYSDATAAFAKTNFKRVRFTGAWGGITGFTTLTPQKGVAIDWAMGLEPVVVDGLGTLDYTVASVVATAKCIPLGPTLAQLKTNSQEESPMGTSGSTISADLVWTGNGGSPSVTLKNAYLKASGVAFGVQPLRMAETTWETTRSFASGAPAAMAVVA